MRKWIAACLVVLSLVICIPTFSAADDTQTRSSWPMFMGDAQHTGRSQFDTAHVTGDVEWKFEPDNWGSGFPSASIGLDGKIYVPTYALTALNKDGSIDWVFVDPFGRFLSTPAVGEEGILYACSDENYMMHAINPNGTIR